MQSVRQILQPALQQSRLLRVGNPPARAHLSHPSRMPSTQGMLLFNTTTIKRAVVLTSPVSQLPYPKRESGTLSPPGRRTDILVCPYKKRPQDALRDTARMDGLVRHYTPEWRAQPGPGDDPRVAATSSGPINYSEKCEKDGHGEAQRDPPKLLQDS